MSDKQTLADALAIAREMRRIHSGPETWTKRADARAADGRPLESVTDPAAVTFCLVGAENRATENLHAEQGVIDAFDDAVWVYIWRTSRAGGWPEWNDHWRRTFADIVALEEAVIADLEAQLAAVQ